VPERFLNTISCDCPEGKLFTIDQISVVNLKIFPRILEYIIQHNEIGPPLHEVVSLLVNRWGKSMILSLQLKVVWVWDGV